MIFYDIIKNLRYATAVTPGNCFLEYSSLVPSYEYSKYYSYLVFSSPDSKIHCVTNEVVVPLQYCFLVAVKYDDFPTASLYHPRVTYRL